MRRVVLAVCAMAVLPAATGAPVLVTCPEAEKAGIRVAEGRWVFAAADLRNRLPMPEEAMTELDRLVDALAGAETEVIAVVYPPRPLVVAELLGPSWDAAGTLSSYRGIVERVGAHGLGVVDLYDTARSVRGEEAFYYYRDHHITPTGARAIGKTVAGAIRAHPSAARLPPATFASEPITRPQRAVDGRGRALEALCGVPVPTQDVQHWRSVRTSAANVGLLDEGVGPEVVFVGTSNLTDRYNLPGFLQESLGAEVLPVEIQGGGLLGALQDWLRSPEWDAHRPAFLLWEFTPQDFWKNPDGAPDPKDPSIYREIVPSVYGGCTDAEAAAVGAWQAASAGEHLLLPDLVANGARGPGWRVLVEAEDPGLREFTLDLELADGARDSHTYVPAMRTATHGRFFLDMPRGATAPLAQVRARIDAPANGRVRARLCPPR